MSSAGQGKSNDENRSPPFPSQNTCPLSFLASIANHMASSSNPSPVTTIPDIRKHVSLNISRYMRVILELTRLKETVAEMRPTLERAELRISHLEQELQSGALFSSIPDAPGTLVTDSSKLYGNHAPSRKRHRSEDNEEQNDIDTHILKDTAGLNNSGIVVVKDDEDRRQKSNVIDNGQIERVAGDNGGSGDLSSAHTSNSKPSEGKTESCGGKLESNAVASLQNENAPSESEKYVPKIVMVSEGGINVPVKLPRCGRSRRLPPKRRRVNWSLEDNLLFISIVKENRHIGEARIRRLLAETFAGRRSHEQCANHLRILRSQGKVPKQEDDTDSVEDK